jgi:predicted pyridoxine 5'-phosphate oxidase superfamily flavin-nucleotide-binding protein
MLNEHTLLIPERPENKLLHGLDNILRTGRIGLLLVIPGTEETLRVNGSASLYEDHEACREIPSNGKPALLPIKVEVEECFFSSQKHLSRVMLGYRQVGSSHKRLVLEHKSPETLRAASSVE